MITWGAGRTDTGRRRENNEDAFAVEPELGLYVVCDGMGGHAAGEVASAVAVRTVREAVEADPSAREAARAEKKGHRLLVALAEKAVKDACAEVHRRATADPKLHGMGCALTMLLAAGSRAVMAHVGDTRLYLRRDGELEQLSTDHTMGHELVHRGIMTPAEVLRTRYGHALTRAVGHQASVEVDTLMIDLSPDDRLLLCSDGLTDHVAQPTELAALLEHEDLDRAAGDLVALALDRGGRDNVTAVVVAVDAPDEEQAAELRRSVRDVLRTLRRVELFADIAFADLMRIASISDVRAFDAGETVVAAGAPWHAMLVVLEGAFELRRAAEPVARLEPGDHVGDTTLLVSRPCRATLVATGEGPSRLLAIDGARFGELASHRPWLGVTLLGKLARLLSTELAETSARLVSSSDDTQRIEGPRHLF